MTNPWDNEDDRADWEAHGLRCALRRGPTGAWCGYVAIPEQHKLYGKRYQDVIVVPQHVQDRPIDIDKIGVLNLFCAKGVNPKHREMQVCLALDCHGGLTYSEALCPQTKKINEKLWWFGFDAGHHNDLIPTLGSMGMDAIQHIYRSLEDTYGIKDKQVYRTQEYMTKEVEELARQLAQWE